MQPRSRGAEDERRSDRWTCRSACPACGERRACRLRRVGTDDCADHWRIDCGRTGDVAIRIGAQRGRDSDRRAVEEDPDRSRPGEVRGEGIHEGMQWAPDHTLDVIYKFGDGTWTQFSNYGGGTRQPGAGGTFSYAADNELLVKDSSGHETYRYDFALKGDTLSLSMLGNPTGDDIEIVRMMSEGTYTQESP